MPTAATSRFFEFLGRAGQNFAGVETQALRDYLADLDARGFKSSSVARRLSAMRHLFRFLLSERFRSDDPAAILSGPKRAAACRRCCRYPTSIACWCAQRRWQKRRKPLRRNGFAPCDCIACLEVLYATGLRVSELGDVAALGVAPRRPHDRGARQGQQGTAGAAERGFATGDGRLPRREGGPEAGEQEKRRARNGCFPRSARADI